MVMIFCCCGNLFAQHYRIGDLYTAPDGSQGIVYYVFPDNSGGWVVALNDASAGCTWGAVGDVPGLANQSSNFYQTLLNDTAGYVNTQILRNYQNNNPAYAAGKVDFAHGWVLPSPAQLSMLFGQLPFITSALTGAGGSSLAGEGYWCSAETDASNAWRFNFNYGYPFTTSKTGSYRVRAVRSFSSANESPEPAILYSWSTGATTSSITVSPEATTTYTVTVTVTGGYTDTVAHTIVVNSPEPQTFYDETCQGETYNNNGFTLTAAETSTPGVHTFTRTVEVDGCITIHTLVLSVLPTADTTIYVTVSENEYPFVLNDSTYNHSGTYTQLLTTAAGCDSLVTLVLTTSHHIDLPDNVLDADCTVPPDPNAFAMTELFSCPNVNSMSTPMVADMDGDGLPEIIACCYTSSAPYYNTGFHVINGQTGELKYTLNTVQYCNSGLMATIADVDHDGTSELFLLGRDQRLYCYNYNGGVRWSSANTVANNYLLSAADVNNDGVAEIVCGEYVYDAQTGVLLLQGTMVETGMGFGAPHGVHLPYYHIPYYMYALGDVDGDGTLELCAGNTIYKLVITNNAGTAGNSWSILRQADTPATIENKDGQTFLVDFDNDGDFDVCVIGITHSLTQSTTLHTLDVYVWDGQTSQVIGHKRLPIHSKAGSSVPFSGDLNGDGYPEIIFSADPGMMAYTYDTVTSSMSVMHSYAPFGETAGFTVFDFNQDGRNEIVYRGTTQLYIADGVTLANLCPPTTAYSGTITEYPIVADVNADGHAEIIVARAYNDWNAGGGANGWVSVYGSATPGTWSSARKVWNQWAYSSVNINEDMTVPQYRFDVSTTFPNGEKPFNGFLRQMPYIDTQGNLFNPVADVVISSASVSEQEDTVKLTLNYCNIGDIPLHAPYPVILCANTYSGEIITTVSMTENLPVDSCVQHVISLPKSLLCEIQGLDALVLVVNSLGSGVAQNGGMQSECDTTNNVSSVAYILQHFDPVELTVSACDSYEWNGTTYTENGDYTVSFPHPGGCDSVVTLHLTVTPTPEATVTATSDTICAGDEVTLQVVTAGGGDPVLHVPPVAIGDILCTDNSIVKPADWPVAGKTAMGVVFYVDNTGEHGWAVHLQDQGASLAWGGYGTDIPSLPNHSGTDIYTDLNGYSNTQAIRAAGNAASYPAAWAVDFNNGWYLPANGQLRVLLSTIVFINATLDLLGGQQFPMDASYTYWSSTEHSANYAGYTQNNDMGGRVKWWTSKVRSVRSF